MRFIRLICLCCLLLASVDSYAAFSCAPAPNKVGKIDRISFSNSEDHVRFTIVNYPYNWMALSPKYDIDTDYGRTMLEILRAAFATGSNVDIDCTKGEINKIRISYQP